jgi:anti-sigma factor RsiW
MNRGFPFHISDDALEEYALGALPGGDFAPLNEHLQDCPACQIALAEIAEYVEVMKAALLELQSAQNGEKLELLGFS